MHTHEGTIRLLIKIVCLLLVGIAVYFVIYYGIEHSAHSGVITSTSTPEFATSSAASTTDSSSGSVTPTTGTAPPSVTPPPSSTGPTATPITITSSDNNTVVQLAVGQSFTVAYGSGLTWSLQFDPETNVIQTAASSSETGTQGTFKVTVPGTITLKATGAPICGPNQACPMFRALSTVTLDVK